MTSLTSRLGLLKPNDVVGIEDDLVDVTAQLSDNYDKIDASVGVFDYTGGQPGSGNFTGRLIRDTATGIVYRYNGTAYEIFGDTTNDSFTPTITPTGTAFTYGSGSVQQGRWRWAGLKCIDFVAFIGIGTGASGGTGQYQFNLPPWGTGEVTAAFEQIMNLKCFANGSGNFFGGLVVPAGAASGANVQGYLDGNNNSIGFGSPVLGSNSNFSYHGKLWLA